MLLLKRASSFLLSVLIVLSLSACGFYTESEIETLQANAQSSGYEEGHDSGYDEGHDAGYNEGYQAGEKTAQENAYKTGYDAGKSDGYKAGYDVGMAEGKKSVQTVKSTAKSSVSTGSTTSQPVTVTVYVTKTGEKYHKSGCQYLRESKIAISLSNAKAQGYTACSKCNPPR